ASASSRLRPPTIPPIRKSWPMPGGISGSGPEGRGSPEAVTSAMSGAIKISEVATDVARSSPIGSVVTTGGPPPRKYGAVANAYLRAAQAYMLISMPTGSSTIFGVFQVISALLLEPDGRAPHPTKDKTRPEIAQACIV